MHNLMIQALHTGCFFHTQIYRLNGRIINAFFVIPGLAGLKRTTKGEIKMLEWLKTILGDAYTEDIDKKVSDEIGKQFVSRSDFNTLNETKKTLESTVETLKTQNGDNEALQKTITDHENTIAQLKKDAENTKKTHTLKDELRAMGVSDPDYIIKKRKLKISVS